jgi:hypothetical protein
MKAKKCMQCGGAKKMKSGGATESFKKLAPPYDKATYADKIAGAKKSSMKKGGMVRKAR